MYLCVVAIALYLIKKEEEVKGKQCMIGMQYAFSVEYSNYAVVYINTS